MEEVAAAVGNLQGSASRFTTDEIRDIVTGLWLTEEEDREGMTPAWEALKKRGQGGKVNAKDLRAAFLLLGTKITDVQVDEAFEAAGAKTKGFVSFESFSKMMVSIHGKKGFGAIPGVGGMPKVPGMDKLPSMPDMPKMPSMPEMPKVPGMDKLPSMPDMPKMEIPDMKMPDMTAIPGMKGAGETLKAARVIDASIKVRMNPLQLRKAGAIINKTQDAGYSDEEINHICRALFLDQTEENMKPAWDMFDKIGRGSLDASSFKAILPLMGEDVADDEIETLFTEADKDGSGLIEFNEFQMLVKAMNPKPPPEEGGFGGFSLPDMPKMPDMPDIKIPGKGGGDDEAKTEAQ